MEKKETVKKETKPVKKSAPKKMKVAVKIPLLNIRSGPSKDSEKTGKFTGIGEFVITKTQKGPGSEKGWGLLESGEGWISLDFTEKV